MARIRHLPLLRLCLAALIALGLVLNGMSSAAATQGEGTNGTVIIAGTVVTLCQFGADTGKKTHLGHSCDQCALRLAPLLTPGTGEPALLRIPRSLARQLAFSLSAFPRHAWASAWARGPPAA